jgi:hypothetical protein
MYIYYFISLSFIIKYFLLLWYKIMIQHGRPDNGTAMDHLRVAHTTLNSLYPPSLSGVVAIANGPRYTPAGTPARIDAKEVKHWECQPEQLVGDVTTGGPDLA